MVGDTTDRAGATNDNQRGKVGNHVKEGENHESSPIHAPLTPKLKTDVGLWMNFGATRKRRRRFPLRREKGTGTAEDTTKD